jgi:hypothetical protein
MAQRSGRSGCTREKGAKCFLQYSVLYLFHPALTSLTTLLKHLATIHSHSNHRDRNSVLIPRPSDDGVPTG